MALLPSDPRQQKLVMAAVLSLGLAGSYHAYVAEPEGVALAAAEAHVDSLELANAKVGAAVRGGSVNKVKAEAAAYRRDLDALRQLVPTGNEVPALLEQVSTAARRAGLELSTVEPLPVIVGDEFDTYRYKISLSGAYHPLGEFLSNVGSLTRIMAPANLRLNPAPAPTGLARRGAPDALLKATLEIQTYVAKGAAPGIAPAVVTASADLGNRS